MTNNTEQQAVPVAQEDREAAADMYGHFCDPGLRHISEEIRAGKLDHWRVTQSFARHRLASLPCKSGEGAGEAPDEDWLTDVIDDSLDMDWTGRVAARAIIAAWGKRHD